jgi:hypothetical protein
MFFDVSRLVRDALASGGGFGIPENRQETLVNRWRTITPTVVQGDGRSLIVERVVARGVSSGQSEAEPDMLVQWDGAGNRVRQIAPRGIRVDLNGKRGTVTLPEGMSLVGEWNPETDRP